MNQANPRPLTRSQREVLQLIAEGKAMKQVAEILEISVRTVELTRYALENRIVPR